MIMVGESSNDVNIPLDLKLEILKKLPAKSVSRFLCVSKLWKTIIKYYIVNDSIVTRSLTQDTQFIFKRVLSLSSSPKRSVAYTHHQTTHKEELLSLPKTYLKDGYCILEFQYLRGLIGYESSPHRCYPRFTIYNLTTRKYVSLAYTPQSHDEICYFFLGYDPLTNQYKVLCLIRSLSKEMSCRVFTLGNSKKQWRNIPCGIERHYPSSSRGSVCINGAIYYKATMNLRCLLVSVDVGFERFNHVQTVPEELSNCLGYATLVDYQGKLGCICRDKLNMDLWVLENTEWSKVTYVDVFRDIPSFFGVAGITKPGGEIVIVSQSQEFTPITVYYYDMKLKKIRRVEIKTSMSSRESIFIKKVITHHVENIMFLS